MSFITVFTLNFVIVLLCCARSFCGKSNIRFPEDSIVFPDEEHRALRSESGEIRKFQHNHGKNFRIRNFQHDPEFHKKFDGNSHSVERNNETLNEIPLDYIQHLNEYNVSEILQNFVEGDEEFDGGDPFLTDRFGSQERNAAVLPKYAGCMPELQTVEIASSRDANVLYIPQCTRIERCGGCCTHHLLECQPVEIQPISFTVVKTQYVGAVRMKNMGKEIVVVDKHTKCKCDCKIKKEDCNRYQEYRKSECRCVCTNTDEEKKCYKNNQTKLWDPTICSCVCREFKQCSTGYEFDQKECKCVPSGRIWYSQENSRSDEE